MSTNPTLLRTLVIRHHRQRFESFIAWFSRVAKALAQDEGEPRLASATIGRRQYERWLAGNVIRRPHPDSCRVLERMFGRTVEELFGPADESRADTLASIPPTGTLTHAQLDAGVGARVTFAVRDATDPAYGAGDDDVHRRTLLRRLAGGLTLGLTAPSLEVIEGLRRSMDVTLTDHGALDLLDEWERRINEYVQANQVTAPLDLLSDALLDFSDVQSALQHGQFGRHRVRLWRLSAQLAGMIGVWLYVLGQQRDARLWFQTGRRAADVCQDKHLCAWMYARSAVVSLHFGSPASALELADRALAFHQAPSGTAVRIHLVRARALARLGDKVNARSALKHARVSFEPLNGWETADKLFGHTERQFLAHSSNVVTSLGDVGPARLLQDAAFTAYSTNATTEHLDPTLIRIDQGLNLLSESDPTSACQQVMDTISGLPTEHRGGLVQVAATGFVAALTPAWQRSRAAAELKDFLRSAFADHARPLSAPR